MYLFQTCIFQSTCIYFRLESTKKTVKQQFQYNINLAKSDFLFVIFVIVVVSGNTIPIEQSYQTQTKHRANLEMVNKKIVDE